MFKKPFHTKPRASVRTSTCRHLIQETKDNFPLFWEQAAKARDTSIGDNTAANEGELVEVAPVPDKLQMAKFVSHIGDKGEIFYSEAGDPLWLKAELVSGEAARLVPTVYTLWQFPSLLPVLWTTPSVVTKLIGGADLMVPGLLVPSNGLPDLKKGALVAVCCPGNQAAQAVGVLNFNTLGVHSVAGSKGKAVLVVHTYMDYLWKEGCKQQLPVVLDADSIDLPDLGDDDDIESNHNGDGGAEEDDNCAWEMVGKPVDSSALPTDNKLGGHAAAIAAIEGVPEAVVETVSAEDMDKLLMGALKQVMATVLDEVHAAELLPINASTIYSMYMALNAPRGKELDIKKSTYKKLAKFLKAAEKNGWLKLKDIRGELYVKSFNWAHQDMAEFTPYVVNSSRREQRAVNDAGAPGPSQPALPTDHPTSESSMIRVVELLKPSSALAPLFSDVGAQTDTGFFTRQQARGVLEDYIKGRQLVDAQNPRMVKLDHRLCDGLLTKEEYSKLSSFPRDKLQARLQEKMTLYTQVILPGVTTTVKIGNPPAVAIVCEKKMGSKVITRVSGLEAYGIDPLSVAKELRTACASSTTVEPIPGKKGVQSVLVQGHHITALTKLLEKNRLPSRLVNIVDKSGKAKTKKQ